MNRKIKRRSKKQRVSLKKEEEGKLRCTGPCNEDTTEGKREDKKERNG